MAYRNLLHFVPCESWLYFFQVFPLKLACVLLMANCYTTYIQYSVLEIVTKLIFPSYASNSFSRLMLCIYLNIKFTDFEIDN